jgi:hypothetical protein
MGVLMKCLMTSVVLYFLIKMVEFRHIKSIMVDTECRQIKIKIIYLIENI